MLLIGMLRIAGCGQARDAAPAQVATRAVEMGVWPGGAAYVYALEIDARSELPGAGAGLSTLSLRGQLELGRMQDADTGTRLHALLHEPEVTTSGEVSASSRALAAELVRPFEVRLDAGHVRDLGVAAGTSPEAAALLRTIAAALQTPERLGGRVAVQEHDATGRYEAQYEARADGSIQKTKLRYLSLLSSGAGLGAGALPRVLESRGTLRAARDGVLEQVSLDDRLSTELPGGAGALQARSSLRLTLVRRVSLDARANAAVDGMLWLSATAPYAQAPGRDRFDALRASGLSVLQALERLGQTSDDATEHGADAETMSAFSSLAALLRKDASGISEVLARADRDPALAPRLFDALASAGTVEAQHALVQRVTDAKAPVAVRQRAARSLIRVQQPSPEQVALLETLVDDPAFEEHGIYGLGTAARRLREAGEQARAIAIAAELGELLGRAHDSARQIRVLRGIANAADATLLAAVRPLLQHTAFGVREAAVAAVQRMTAPEVDGLLIARLRGDAHASVRVAAADAIGSRTASAELSRALAGAALDDADAHVRDRALAIMADWLGTRAELRPALEKAARTDLEPKLRERAARALAQHPPG
jgi:hypothetical protein